MAATRRNGQAAPGWVIEADGVMRTLSAGEAALGEPGEKHASGTDGGLRAGVVQCRVPPLTEETP